MSIFPACNRFDASWRWWFRSGLCPRLFVVVFAQFLFLEWASAQEANDNAVKTEEKKGAEAVAPVEANPLSKAYLVRIGLPLRGAGADSALQALVRIAGQTSRAEDARTTVVLEFRPLPNRAEEASVYEDCLKIARFLTGNEASRLRTIAWIPRTSNDEGVAVKGHAVLVAIACEEMIVDTNASLGEAGILGRTDADMRRTYEEISRRRLSLPPAVAVAMLEKEVTLTRITQAEKRGDSYVLDEEFGKIQAAGQVLESETLKSPGSLASFRGGELSRRHFASHLAGDLNDLADALNVPASAIDPGVSLDGNWHPVRIDLRGPITHTEVARIKKSLSDRVASGHDVNLVCIWIDSAGGSLAHSVDLAQFIADTFDPSKVRTVAYVPRSARSDAALVAMACDQVVMHEGAVLGGPGDGSYDPQELADFARIADELAGKKARSRSVLRAMVDSNIKVYRYTKKGGNLPHFLSEDEVPRNQREDWQQGREIGIADGLDVSHAVELDIASAVVASYDEFLQLYHLPNDLEVLSPNWAHTLIAALASPGMAMLLLFVGFVTLFIEMKAPGIGVPAFISTLCFLMFFWSRFLNGTADWLEVILFLGGLFFLALEVFVLPGFGIFGLGGGVMVLSSIVLASQTFVIPRNTYQLHRFSVSLGTLTLTLISVGAALILLRKHLKRTPMVNRVMLEPGGGISAPDLNRRESLVNLEHLVGKTGQTTTLLAPSGQARFGDALVDVISDGELISRGESIVVKEVQGSRVLVRRASV